MTAATKRLRRALGLLGQAIDELHASLPLTPENAALLKSIRRDREQLLDVVTTMERAEATR